MNINLINPFIRYADKRDFEVSINHEVIAYDCRIFYIINGEYELISENNVYKINSKDIVYIPSSVPYKIVYSNFDISQIKINFDFFEKEKKVNPLALPLEKPNRFNVDKLVEQSIPSPFDKIIIVNESERFEAIFEEIVAQMKIQRNEYEHISGSFLKGILAYIKQICMVPTPQTNLLVDTIIKYIQKNYMKQINSQDIRFLLNYHPVYINQQFKLATSLSIHQYLLTYRCTVAKSLLLTSDLSMQDIAYKTGFQSAAHFSQIFKDKVGISPLKFRKLYQIP